MPKHIGKMMSIRTLKTKRCKLTPTVTFFYPHVFFEHERVRKTILRA